MATGPSRAAAAAPTCSRHSGVNVTAPPAAAERCLADAGIAFLFAPTFHPSMRHAGPTRRELGLRTAFNLLGPLTNPARPRRQLVGVPRPELTQLLARVAAAARVRARLGGARRRRYRRDIADRVHEGVRVPRRDPCGRSTCIHPTSACARCPWKRSPAGTRPRTPPSCGACWPGTRDRAETRSC